MSDLPVSFADITTAMEEEYNERYNLTKKEKALTEAYDKNRQLQVDLLPVDQFVKVNDLKEITNPIFFIKDGAPTPDGLLSNEIFGITKEQRSGNFAYIDLMGTFMNPLCYKMWFRMDSKVRNIVHETNTYIINAEGKFEEDPKGKTGIKFLKEAYPQLNYESSGNKKDIKLRFLDKAYKDGTMFITKYPVIPAYYRDVDTSKGHIGVGEINQMYCSLLNATRAIKMSQDYGLNLGGMTRGRIQEILLNIYDWFSKEPNISKKHGIIKRAVLSKTTDYASRLVLSAPDLEGERAEDMMVDVDHCALPLASALVNFFPFVMYYLNSWFSRNFSGMLTIEGYNAKTKQMETREIGNWQEAFSPMNIKKQIDRFVHGFSNRFIPVEIPVKAEKNEHIYAVFTGARMSREEYIKAVETNDLGNPKGISDRPLTWCDLFYMAACEIAKDKCILITRYPIDSCYNQYPSLFRISSTVETESVVINGQFYSHYPHITKEMIGSDTSSMFVDTLRMANPMTPVMGADYDGDQVTVKGVYFDESNQELKNYINSKRQFVNLGGKCMRTLEKQGLQCMYNLTLALPGTELTKDIKFGK